MKGSCEADRTPVALAPDVTMSSPPLQILRIEPSDAAAFRRFRMAAIAEAPDDDSMTIEEEREASLADISTRLNGVAGKERFVLAAQTSGESEWGGLCGFYRQPGVKTAHVGWIWGLYVIPSQRGKGVATALMAAMLQNLVQIEGLLQVQARVAVNNQPARHVFERSGFSMVTVLPRAIRVGATDVDEVLLLHHLGGGAGASAV